MDSEKIELRKLLFKHSAKASNLLRSDYNSLNTALTRYLNFIDGQPVTRTFIEDCLANHLPSGFDENAEIDEVISDPYTIFDFPPSCEGESAVTYLVLKAIVDRNLCQSFHLLLGYAHGSNKFDNMAEGFLNDVARRLVNGVNQAITLKGIELGLDESMTQVNNFGNSGAAIASQTTNGSSTTINQSNGIDVNALNDIIGELESSLHELSRENRTIAADAIAAMKDVLEAPQPKPSILKSLWNTLKGINEGATFIENVTKLGALIAPILPGITG